MFAYAAAVRIVRGDLNARRHGSFVIVVALAGLVVALAVPASGGTGSGRQSGAAAVTAVPSPPTTLPPATYQTVAQDVAITMDDGVQLAATLTFPSTAARPSRQGDSRSCSR